MKVISISNPEKNDELEFAESLLSRSIFNDKLFDRIHFKIVIKLDDPSDYLYRILWESVYLNRSKISRCDHTQDRIILYPSLSEIIGYIYTTTPPRLAHLIPDSIKTIEEINNSITQFLIDDHGGQLITYHSYFKQYMRLGRFETKFTYNKERASLIMRSINDIEVDSVVDIESSPLSIDDLLVYDKTDNGGCIQMTLYYKNPKDTGPVCEMISSKLDGPHMWEISNVSQDDSGIYITIFTMNYDGNMPLFIRTILENQYH